MTGKSPKSAAAARPAAAIAPADRRQRRRQATRALLLHAGRALLAERGLYEARIEDVAMRADIAKGTVYLHFPGKDHLVREVVGRCLDELGDAVEARAAGARTLEEALRRAAEAHLDLFERSPGTLRILHQARGMLLFGRAEWRPLREPLERYLGRLTRALAAAPGRPGRARARRLAEALYGSLSGWASVHRALSGAGGGTAWRRDVVDAAVRLGAVAPAASRAASRARPGGARGRTA